MTAVFFKCLVFGILCFEEEEELSICENIPNTKHQIQNTLIQSIFISIRRSYNLGKGKSGAKN